jgi:23S rRNA maturation-related 3'-5' exoribonuclease YhaM
MDTKAENNKQTILALLNSLSRPGVDKLIEFLESSDYFTAPASTKYHRSYPGGLSEHSLNVTPLFKGRNDAMGSIIRIESVIICGLLHDVCKVGYYVKAGNSYKSVKGHSAANSHASLSIAIIEKYIELHPIEKEIILYHMGLFGCFGYCVEYSPKDMHSAISRNPAVQIFAACDMEESKWID